MFIMARLLRKEPRACGEILPILQKSAWRGSNEEKVSDYGFFPPTPMFWSEGGRTGLPKGRMLTLHYRVVIHASDVKTAGIKQVFEQYKQTANMAAVAKIQNAHETNK